jgi:hypothetical protein
MVILRACCVLSFILAACVAGAQEGTLNLFVAPGGNDGWSGTSQDANATSTDGPLATLTGARDLIRKLRADGKAMGPIRVQLRGGDFHLTEPVAFAPEDSGSAEAPVVFEAYPGEQPVIDGGRRINGWTKEGDFWVADVPEVREGKWTFGALWVNGVRATLARTPNAAHPNGDEPSDSDYFYTDGPVIEKDAAGNENKSNIKLHYREGDLKAWANLDEATVVAFHSWETALLHVKSIDEANRVVEFTGPSSFPFCYWIDAQRYFVENLFEGLDQPGEWCVNRKAGKVYYIPRPGEDMSTVEAVAPVAKQLISLSGKPAEGKFISNLAFRNLNFFHTDYPIEPQGHSDGQAASSIGAAIEMVGARDCVIERCRIGHVGTYGVWFRSGSRNNTLEHSEVFDLGAGGVRFGEGGDPATENEAASRNVADNNFIHDGGRIFRGAVGVWIGRSSYNTLSHNEICDFRYTGVSVGWSWGYEASSANHNIIKYNHIHHVGRGQLSDMGAIYTLGVSPGTVIESNVIHDIMSYPRVSLGLGIYFDEGSTDILAENNLVYNTLSGGFHQHYGRDNRVQNNIFAFSHRPQLVRSREEDHNSFYFERNIVYYNNGQLLGGTWLNGNYAMADNCYWDASGQELDFAGKTSDEWRASGHDQNSVMADPLFINAEAADFRLKPESPALKLGFQSIDFSLAGLYGEPEWVALPKQIDHEPFNPPKPPEPTHVSDDFEKYSPGTTPSEASVYEEEHATIRVTDETAATGKQCLKFIDAPGLKNAFDPHMAYFPHLRQGLATASFAVRLEPGAIFYHEWRDSKNPYRIGPSLWFNAEGELTVAGKTLLKAPLSQWLKIQVECKLGNTADGVFTLTVTLPGQEPQRFENLSCGNAQFQRLDWLGFVSNGVTDAAIYLDDVSVSAK